MSEYSCELYHFGVKGMKWGVRRQEKMRKKAEKQLGRSIKSNDFGGEITNRGIRKVKKYDELEKAYKKVKKKGDPSFDWVHGMDPRKGTVLSDRKIKLIIRKMEKNPSTNVEKAVNRAHYAQKGEQIAAKLLVSSIATVAISELARRYGYIQRR